ncbi:MAG: hypothetical protein GTO12_13120, partial [Proteobacteria bacterium]|nr:hypothetical protein [Pseudomonadota bacterium]
MALTDDSDLYAAIHDGGINRVARHIMQQRPSLFNYGTAQVESNLDLLCKPIDAVPEVTQFITVQDPLPLLGTDGAIGLNYCFQLTSAQIDFHPGDIFTLPPELNPPLDVQRFAFHVQVCAGLGCWPKDLLDRFQLKSVGMLAAGNPSHVSLTAPSALNLENVQKPSRDHQIVLPSRELECFCLDLFATGQGEVIGSAGNQKLRVKIDGLEIVDLKPEGLENSLECYMHLLLNLVVLPQASDAISELLFNVINLGDLGTLTLSASTAVPNNPAVEDDQLKIFLNLDAISINPIVFPAPETPGEPGEPSEESPTTREIRTRSRTGPSDLTAAISEDAFRRVFSEFRDAITIAKSGSEDLGPFSASYSFALHLENGTVDFRDDNTIRISELDIKWDELWLGLGIDIPEICVGGFCLIPTPLGCALRVPEKCFFSDNPDINIGLDLTPIFNHEITMTASPVVYYATGTPNRWQIFLDPKPPIDIDLIDIADTVGDILEDALNAAVDVLLGPIPDWAKDLILAILGPVIDVIRDILDLTDDVGEWLSDLLNINLGLLNIIAGLLLDFFANKTPLFELEDPVPVLPASGALIPVGIPVEF